MTSADLTSRRVRAALGALWSAPTWRATGNALAASLVALVGGILLGGLGLIWWAAIDSLVDWPVGGWSHAALYIAVVMAGPVLVLWAVQGLTALQRSRLATTVGLEIPAGSRTAERKPWPIGALARRRDLAPAQVPPAFDLHGGGQWRAGGGLLAGSGGRDRLPGRGPPARRRRGRVCVAAVALLLAAPWLARQVTRADVALARALLGPSHSEELALRLESLTRSRADIVAATDAERRRIERDLHDGAQQRLVSLAMKLGMARERFTSAPEPVRLAIADAHDEAILALSELREFIRGLYPAVLNDRGLDAALSGLAARAPLPVRLRVDAPRPASPSVEAVAYFIVSEALTNVAKHAQATQAEVTVTRHGDMLRIAVSDDGSGGAVPAGSDGARPAKSDGTGLLGLAQRAAAVDGTLTIDSPRAALVIRRQYPEIALLVLSQYVEESYATDLLSAASSSVGYLLKDRVAHVGDFLDAVRRVAAGGTALDPEVVAQLLVRRRDDPLSRLTPRELQVLRLMAEGRSNGIIAVLKVSPSAVEKYVTNIFAKLDLPPTSTDHRRVLAVLKYLGT